MLRFFLGLKADLESYFPKKKYLQVASKEASIQVAQNRATCNGTPGVTHGWMHGRASGRAAGHSLSVVSSVHTHFQGLKNGLHELTLGPSRTCGSK